MSGTNEAADRMEANKNTVKRMLERLNAGDMDAFLEPLHPQYVRHCQAMPPEHREMRGTEAMRAWLRSNQATFPDYRERVEWMVAEGDYVAWRSKGTGTMEGPMGPFPATGRTMEIEIMGMHRFEGGRIVETWTSWDNVAAMMQLGLMPGGEE